MHDTYTLSTLHQQIAVQLVCAIEVTLVGCWLAIELLTTTRKDSNTAMYTKILYGWQYSMVEIFVGSRSLALFKGYYTIIKVINYFHEV